MTPFARIQHYWVYGGALAGLLLLALVPLLWGVWPLPVLAVYLGLPLYMLHQLEEHDDNRFGNFVNEHIGKGREVLGYGAIFWINIGLVWAWQIFALYLTARVSVGLGMLAVLPVLVNALVHIAQGARMRLYNPGLITAIVLLLPWSIWAGYVLVSTGEVGAFDYLWGLVAALAIHGVIIGYVIWQLRSGKGA